MSLVLMPVSIAGLRHCLRLPDDVKIVSAGTVQRFAALPAEADVLMLAVDMPDVPEGAATVEAIYQDTGHRDPVEFERFTWRAADGTEIEPETGANGNALGFGCTDSPDPFADKAAQRGG